jgi:hypothetical protein
MGIFKDKIFKDTLNDLKNKDEYTMNLIENISTIVDEHSSKVFDSTLLNVTPLIISGPCGIGTTSIRKQLSEVQKLYLISIKVKRKKFKIHS